MSAVPSIECASCKAANDPAANFCARCGHPLKPGLSRPSTRPPAPTGEVDYMIGRLIDSRYRVLERIGQGGMGLVYKVEHQRMGKIAAMKVLRRDLAEDKEVVKRFRREAEAISKLSHPNTVQVFDFGTEGRALYLVMEYVRGEDMGVILQRDGAISFARAAPMFLQICGALAEAHELGIVHRDLKPENVLVTRTKDGHDHVKVLDFGLAKLSEREEASDVSSREAIVGTPYYMAPEQIRGEELDQRADIYALGAMMYRVLSGEPPFTAATPVGVLTKHLTDELIPLDLRRPDRPQDPRVAKLVARAMAKSRDARYPTVEKLAEDLAELASELGSASVRNVTRSQEGAVPASAAGPNLTPRQLARPPERRTDPGETDERRRLQRQDIDAFERSLRRKAILRVTLPPLLAVGLAVGGYFWWRDWQARPRTAEVEVNDTTEEATLIDAGRPVSGIIGRRRSLGEGDIDVFRVPVPRGLGSPARVDVKVSGLRNMDLELAVLDGAGREVAVADTRGAGLGESLAGIKAGEGSVFVAVRESRRDSQTGQLSPTENVSDRYEVTVDVAAFDVGQEREPDDSDSDATLLAPGITGSGTLARFGDVDKWRWTGPAGEVRISVRPATAGDELPPLRLRVGAGDAVPGRELVTPLGKDAIVAVERADDPGALRKPLAGAEARYVIEVR